MNFEILTAYGIDYRQGIHRCLDEPEVYHEMLVAFLEDKSFPAAKAAFEKKDYSGMFAALHELKGACGNADFTELFRAVQPLVEQLREYDPQRTSEAEIAERFARVERAYERAYTGVSIAVGM